LIILIAHAGEDSMPKVISKPLPSKLTERIVADAGILALIRDEYLAAMGRVSAAWALLDHHLDMAICQLALTPQFLGICVTSQIQSTPAKLNALGGLMRAHGMSDDRTAWLDSFQQKTYGLARKRNRAVHDAIMIGYDTRAVYRLTAITAPDKTPEFGITPSSPQELVEAYNEITTHVTQFLDFWHETSGEFETLRQTVPLSYFQILLDPPQQAQPRASEGKPRRRR
jgi:hypothetical protein